MSSSSSSAVAALARIRELLQRGQFAEAERAAATVVARAPATADAHNLRGVALRQLGRLAEAAEAFALAVRHAPEIPELHCNLGLALKRIGRVSQAVPHLRYAATHAPQLLQAAQHLQQSYQALVPRWHFTMLRDRPRNDAYEQALRSVVRPGQRVLDIGTGSGLLAMMAARAGAGEVVACEAVPLIAEKAREIVARNGFADRVRVVAKPSNRLVPGTDLGGPADVLVTEIFDAALIGEGALATYEDAWARLLAADATVIPRAATIRAQLVESPDLCATLTVDTVNGFDLSGFNEFASRTLPTSNLPPFTFRPLSAPMTLFEIDFRTRRHAPAEQRLVPELIAAGAVDAVLVWFTLELTPTIVYDNAPDAASGGSHWGQMVQLVAPARSVAPGERLALLARHDCNSLRVELA